MTPFNEEEEVKEDFHTRFVKSIVSENLKYEIGNVTNHSTSCADETLVDVKREDDDAFILKNNSDFETIPKTDSISVSIPISSDNDSFKLSSISSDSCVGVSLNVDAEPFVTKYQPPRSYVCDNCKCGETSGQSPVTLPGTNRNFVKKQTCYHCGTPGHIARNCPNRAYVPYYAQGRSNRSRGKPTRNSSRSRSDGNDWNQDKLKNQANKGKQVFVEKKRDETGDSRKVNSRSVSPDSSKGSSSRKRRRTNKSQKKDSKPVQTTPIKSTVSKQKWVPTGKFHTPPSLILQNKSLNKQDQPSDSMDWVPETN